MFFLITPSTGFNTRHSLIFLVILMHDNHVLLAFGVVALIAVAGLLALNTDLTGAVVVYNPTTDTISQLDYQESCYYIEAGPMTVCPKIDNSCPDGCASLRVI